MSTAQTLFLLAVLAGGPTITEDFKFTSSDVAQSDKFGFWVARSGETSIVSAIGDGNDSGAVYVFTRAPTWTEVAKLVAHDGAVGDWYGYCCDIDGDTIAIGSRADDDLGGNSGSVYVYTGAGASWTLQAKLTASDGEATDLFGHAVAIDGDTIVVGAIGDDDEASAAGAAYVFVRSGTTWTEQAKLTASDGQKLDEFGTAVVVDGETVVVGSIGDNENGDNSGSVYVYTRTGTLWRERVELRPEDGETSDNFGTSLALEDGVLAVGTPGDDDHGATSGSAYVFVGGGASWIQQAKLVPDDGSAGAQLGESIALEGNRVVVGAWNEWHVTSGAGSAYEFVNVGGDWRQRQKMIASDADTSDNFGGSLTLVGGTVVVGAENEDSAGNNSGSAYFYELTVGVPYCFGDASGTSCPCGNQSAAGAGEGCVNSSGRGARAEAYGSESAAGDDLMVFADGLLPSQAALLFGANNAIAGGAGVHFGDGLRCAGGGVVRLGVVAADAAGSGTWGPGLRAMGGWDAGDTRRFQVWYRDPVGGPCGSGFNLSGAIEIVFGL